jgi:hypothetical protein
VTGDLDRLPKRARRAAEANLDDDEHIVTVIEGRSRQALILTDRKVLIVKSGWIAGTTFGAKFAALSFAEIAAINVHTGPGIVALEVVKAGSKRPKRADLRAALQQPNWLPCHRGMGESPVIAELRAFVRSEGRSQSARAALSGP